MGEEDGTNGCNETWSWDKDLIFVGDSLPFSADVFSVFPFNTGVFSVFPFNTDVISVFPFSTDVFSVSLFTTGVFSISPFTTGVFSVFPINTGVSDAPLCSLHIIITTIIEGLLMPSAEKAIRLVLGEHTEKEGSQL